eukprot:g831.t1
MSTTLSAPGLPPYSQRKISDPGPTASLLGTPSESPRKLSDPSDSLRKSTTAISSESLRNSSAISSNSLRKSSAFSSESTTTISLDFLRKSSEVAADPLGKMAEAALVRRNSTEQKTEADATWLAQEQKNLEEALRLLERVPSILRPPPLLPNGEVDEEAANKPLRPSPSSTTTAPPPPCSADTSCGERGSVVLCASSAERTCAALLSLQRIAVSATKRHRQLLDQQQGIPGERATSYPGRPGPLPAWAGSFAQDGRPWLQV